MLSLVNRHIVKGQSLMTHGNWAANLILDKTFNENSWKVCNTEMSTTTTTTTTYKNQDLGRRGVPRCLKNENLKILTKTHVIYIKRKLRTCKMQIQVEKVWFVTKKMEKFNFEKKILKIIFFQFFVTNHTFSTWIWILHVFSFLLRYITWVLVKIFKFSLFYYRISIKNQVLSLTSHS